MNGYLYNQKQAKNYQHSIGRLRTLFKPELTQIEKKSQEEEEEYYSTKTEEKEYFLF